MSSAAEAGAGLAWRLLATLEGGSLLVATSALVAYSARLNLARRRRQRSLNSFLVTNCTNSVGQELKRRLEAEGCTVDTLTGGATSAADKVDCLVVVGAESKAGLEGISRLVSEDVYDNLNLLESLSARVRRGGSIAWACADAGAESGAYGNAVAAFDAVIQASLRHIAQNSHCEPIWIGRCESVGRTVDRLLAKLLPCSTPQRHGFSIRNAVHTVTEFLGGWLKMAT